VLEETTDIMNEKPMTVREGRIKAEIVSQWWVIERGERRKNFFGFENRLSRTGNAPAPHRANLITSRL